MTTTDTPVVEPDPDTPAPQPPFDLAALRPGALERKAFLEADIKREQNGIKAAYQRIAAQRAELKVVGKFLSSTAPPKARARAPKPRPEGS